MGKAKGQHRRIEEEDRGGSARIVKEGRRVGSGMLGVGGKIECRGGSARVWKAEEGTAYSGRVASWMCRQEEGEEGAREKGTRRRRGRAQEASRKGRGKAKAAARKERGGREEQSKKKKGRNEEEGREEQGRHERRPKNMQGHCKFIRYLSIALGRSFATSVFYNSD